MRIGVKSLACSAGAMALMASATPSMAQGQIYRFDMPAQDLGGALRLFGQLSRQQIIFSEDNVRAKRAPALTGAYTADQGLQRLLASSGLGVQRTSAGVIVVGKLAMPTTQVAEAVFTPPPELIVVTGSRIRRSDTSTAAPVAVFEGGSLNERGYAQIGLMLNQVTSNSPEQPESPTQGFPSGSGQTYPNLFNLGDGRTLSLIDGRRMVPSGSGLGSRAVDVNVIPAGLVQRVEIVEGGGAATYGSDAIAGVVNYILKKDFQGAEMDAQYGEDYRGGYQQPSIRITAGRNFDSGRGNIAADFEYSQTSPILEYERQFTSLAPRSVTNPLNTGLNDGQPPTIYIQDGRIWRYTRNGVIFTKNSTSPSALLQSGGSPVQFSADGSSIIPYNTGLIQGLASAPSSTAIGGDGTDPRDLSTLLTGVQRFTGALVGHYDLTPHLRVSEEIIYAHEIGRDPYGTESIYRFVGGGTGSGPINFTAANPYLTAAEVATLSAAYPAFAAGSPLTLSKFLDILPSREGKTTTDTGRGLIGLEGDFRAFDRDFYWSTSFTHGETYTKYQVWAPYLTHLDNALNAVKNGSGQIVCAINADATTSNDDPNCATLNPFGAQTASLAARSYVSVLTGNQVHNTQDDFLATLGGQVIRLTTGELKFSLAYEHRAESAKFTPSLADQDGLSFSTSVPESGRYHTDELSGELLVPVVGGAFTLPLVKKLEFNGSYRYVENSLAGGESVWDVGGRWEIGWGLTLRASRSRNFSAPTLGQQFAPATIAPGNPASDPCDMTLINSGSNPAVRLANCKRLFAAHPEYGPLATFSDPAVNTGVVAVTYGGNANLHNEVSNTVTYGLIYQPSYVEGLSFGVDRVEIHLSGALEEFTPNNFLATCYDATVQPAAICSTFTRNAQGYVATATDETFNAGSVTYHGEVYSADYAFALGQFFAGRDFGVLNLGLETTHTTRLDTSVTGFDLTHSAGTTAMPRWRTRFDARWSKGPLRLFYSLYALPSAMSSYGATIESTPVPILKANYTHTVSLQFDYRNLTFRAGVDNLTNQQPSFPSRSYGDILGRRYFAGVHARF